jgi:hypothetical protein
MEFIRFPAIVAATVLTYAAVHLPEEAAGNFPAFMERNFGVKGIGYARWLFHNAAVFMPVLLAGLLVFLIDETRFVSMGLGISFWGLLNFFEHLFFTLKNRKVAPGLYSSLVFLALAALAVLKLGSLALLDFATIAFGGLAALGYWAAPIGLIFLLMKPLDRLFEKR